MNHAQDLIGIFSWEIDQMDDDFKNGALYILCEDIIELTMKQEKEIAQLKEQLDDVSIGGYYERNRRRNRRVRT